MAREASVSKASVRDAELDGRRALVRVDFNVPLDGGRVADDTRIRAALPTIELLRERGAARRPRLAPRPARGRGRPGALAAPVAAHLASCSAPRCPAPAVIGPDARAMADALAPGEVLLLENVRFEPGETKNDPELAEALAELADVYVNDAFGTAHRAHASTEGVARLLPGYAGLLLEREVTELTPVVEPPSGRWSSSSAAPRSPTRSA